MIDAYQYKAGSEHEVQKFCSDKISLEYHKLYIVNTKGNCHIPVNEADWILKDTNSISVISDAMFTSLSLRNKVNVVEVSVSFDEFYNSLTEADCKMLSSVVSKNVALAEDLTTNKDKIKYLWKEHKNIIHEFEKRRKEKCTSTV